MNALQYTFNNVIRTQIPLNILELAFPNKHNQSLSIEERMLVNCLRPIVMTDMNILGGVMMYASIANCKVIASSDYNGNDRLGSFIIDIPKSITGGRSVISVYSLVMGDYAGSNTMHIPGCASPIMGDSTKMFGAMSPSNVIQTSRLEMVGENKVLIEAYPPYITHGVLTINVSNNANLENIQPPYYNNVSKMCLLGLKMYIYNNLRVKIDMGQLYAGHELTMIKEIVDSYADASEEYQEYRKVWAKIALLNDSRKASMYMSTMIGMMA